MVQYQPWVLLRGYQRSVGVLLIRQHRQSAIDIDNLFLSL